MHASTTPKEYIATGSGHAPDTFLLVPPLHVVRSELAKPAEVLFLHNLTGTLEAAIRATNAQFDKTDLLQRLDVRLLDVSVLCNPVAVLHNCSETLLPHQYFM